jgi:rhodanese-related sulfurtransferase
MPVREVDVEQLESLLARGARVVDVREAHEFAAGRVPGAQHIPMGTVPDNIDRFRSGDSSDPVYVICQSGGRSHRVCEYLADQGIDAVNVAGGTGAWVLSGRQVELSEESP